MWRFNTMLNSRYISVGGLDTFRDELLTQSILSQDSATVVPAGTTPNSLLTYYTRSGSGTEGSPYVYTVADPQPTAAVSANTYWLLGDGSPNDVTRTASVRALTQYVKSGINTAVSGIDYQIENVIAPAIDGKVSSVEYNSSTGQLSYTNGGTHPIVQLEAGNDVTITYTRTSAQGATPETGKITFASTDTKNTAGATVQQTPTKLFLVGATAQSANPQTYSHVNAYIDSDGYLYSNGSKINVSILATQTYVGDQITLAIGNAMAASY